MSFTKKIVAFDLDGTITESNQLITEEMAVLLSKLLSNTKVGIITGASFEKMKYQLTAFWDYINSSKKENLLVNLILLPANGSVCYEMNKDTCDWQLTSKEDIVLEGKEKIVETLEDLISSGKYDISKNPIGKLIVDKGKQMSLSTLGADAPLSLKKPWDQDKEKRKKIIEDLKLKLPEFEILIGGNTTIDILPKGFNKGVGLKHLLEKFNYSISDMIFVGDAIFPGGNDYPAFEAGIESLKVSGPEETAKIIENFIA